MAAIAELVILKKIDSSKYSKSFLNAIAPVAENHPLKMEFRRLQGARHHQYTRKKEHHTGKGCNENI